MKRQGLGIALVVISVVLLAGKLLYLFGTPQAPVQPETPASPPAGDAADEGSQGGGKPPMGGEVVEGEVPPPDPNTPLAIEIPGCTCHSDDPQIVEEHAEYRMNECAGCLVGGPESGG